MDELPPALLNRSKNRQARVSVSAEAYGKFNQKKQFIPKIIKKSNEQKRKIEKRLSKVFMFQALGKKEKELTIDVMNERKYEAGEIIIQQGDDGDDLYVVESGHLDCYQNASDGSEKFLLTYGPGDAFGELALLYNTPRGATIKAKTAGTLWSLDRESFNNIVKEAAIKKREKYEKFLSGIKLLADMRPYERIKIADALRPMHFDSKEFVIRQGDTGDSFFFIEDGQAVALKVNFVCKFSK